MKKKIKLFEDKITKLEKNFDKEKEIENKEANSKIIVNNEKTVEKLDKGEYKESQKQTDQAKKEYG